MDGGSNGASLEDCYTNIFALADLTDLRWRRLRPSGNSVIKDPLKDCPVLTSYVKCAHNGDLLCAWTKTSSDGGNPPLSRELWIFWYSESNANSNSDEPNSINDCISSDLSDYETGSWGGGGGLSEQKSMSYECRTMFFKSIHNFIERRFLTVGFTRIGKWFFRPLNFPDNLMITPPSSSSSSSPSSSSASPSSAGSTSSSSSPSTSSSTSNSSCLAFNFNYFLHGDSPCSLCSSIDLQPKRSVYRLSRYHLNLAQSPTPNAPVEIIIAPYGVRGILSPNEVKDTDPQAMRMMEDWKMFFPLPPPTSNQNNMKPTTLIDDQSSPVSSGPRSVKSEMDPDGMNSSSSFPPNGPIPTSGSSNNNMPQMVEIIISDGLRTKYPTCFVFVVHPTTPSPITIPTTITTTSNTTAPVKSNNFQSTVSLDRKLIPCPDVYLTPPNSPPYPAVSAHHPTRPCPSFIVRTSTDQESSVERSTCKKDTKEDGDGVDTGWHFYDPFSKILCNCVRKQKKNAASTKMMGNKKEKKKVVPPFHKRVIPSPVSNGVGASQWDKDAGATSNSNLDSLSINATMSVPGSSNHYGPGPSTVGSLNNNMHSSNIPLTYQPKTPVFPSYKSPAAGALASLQSGITTPGGGACDSPLSVSNGPASNGPGSVLSSGLPSVSPHPGRETIEHPDSIMSQGAGPSPAPSSSVNKEKSQLERLLSPCNTAPTIKMEENSNSTPWQMNSNPPTTEGADSSMADDECEVLEPILPIGQSSLYDYTSISTDAKEWDLPAPKRRRPLNKPYDPTFSDFILGREDKEKDLSGVEESNDVTDNRKGQVHSLESNIINTWAPSYMMGEMNFNSVLTPQFNDMTIYNDVDHNNMFDNSNGDSGDDSNDGQTKAKVHAGPSAQELSTMFPTPPSLGDSNASPQLSIPPEGDHEGPGGPSPSSPHVHVDRSKDPTDVYRPTMMCKFVTSYKYASLLLDKIPLEILPAPVCLPPEARYIHSRGGSTSAYPPQHTLPNRMIPSSMSQPPPPHASSSSTHSKCPMPAPPPGYDHRVGNTRMPFGNMNGPSDMFNFHPPPIRTMSGPRTPGGSSVPVAPPFGVGPVGASGGNQQMPVGCGPMMHSPLSNRLTSSSLTGHDVYNTNRNGPIVRTGGASYDSMGGTSMGINALPEVTSLLVNLALSDSILNLFKDHNFESCTICVCNMNTRGADSRIYLPESLMSGADEAQYKCSCGFSAAVNRKKSQFSGLFYEDELEVTEIPYEPFDSIMNMKATGARTSIHSSLLGATSESGDLDSNGGILLEILKSQCSYMLSSASVLSKTFVDGIISSSIHGSTPVMGNEVVEDKVSSDSAPPSTALAITKRNPMMVRNAVRSDYCEIAFMALISGKAALDSYRKLNRLTQEQEGNRIRCLHDWLFEPSSLPRNNQDVVRFLKTLTPMLQEAVPKKQKIKGFSKTAYTVNGPLTWKQFHQLAGRGTEDQCEAQPIPSLMVGNQKEWVGVAPFALGMWGELSLEPFSCQRDVTYFVLAPDHQFCFPKIRSFFKELTTMYETTMRLGRHVPVSKKVRDGIIRVGKKSATSLIDVPIEDVDWFNNIADTNLAAKLKVFSQVCTGYVVPLLKEMAKESGGFGDLNRPKNSTQDTPCRPTVSGADVSGNEASSSNARADGDRDREKGTGDSMSGSSDATTNSQMGTGSQPGPNSSSIPNSNPSNPPFVPGPSFDNDNEEDKKIPAIVIYIVEPFTFGCKDRETFRTAVNGLMRCFSHITRQLPEHQSNINLQILSLDAITNLGVDYQSAIKQDQLKSLAMSVYGQCRKIMSSPPAVKSLTGFGPAASLDSFIKKLKETDDRTMHSNRYFCPPYVLSPIKDKDSELGDMGERKEKSRTLHCSYCLTEDQKFLVASVCDEIGEIMELHTINIEIPNRTRRKGAQVMRVALNKLMEFLISVMSDSMEPWRLVIGRLGRLGHGELREWCALLSKKALLKATARLKEKCDQCKTMSHYEVPSIMSACLISLEPDSSLRVFPDQFRAEDRSHQHKCSLSTPEDASATHLFIFPTSATTSSSQGNFQGNQDTMGEDDLLNAFGGNLDAGDELGDDGMNDFFNWGDDDLNTDPIGQGSPRQSGLGTAENIGLGTMSSLDGPGKKDSSAMDDLRDEPLQLQNQPLALGYYVSTAPTGPLPKWFWSSTPHLKDVTPVFLKAALLIHTPTVHQQTDDFLNTSSKNGHPLDSNLTTDVLRYTLEGYNSLSWLALDDTTHDRKSCLPLHIQNLMQLYNSLSTLS